MIKSKIKYRTIIVLFTLAAMTAASVYVFRNKALAAGFHGKIFTTTFDGQTVPQNHYSSKMRFILTAARRIKITHSPTVHIISR